MKNKQKEWHPATKPLKNKDQKKSRTCNVEDRQQKEEVLTATA